MTPPKFKLSFFNVTAFGEPARFLFAYAGIKYEDDRIEWEEWPKHKSRFPYGQIPTLEVDGKQINQTLAICRYLARLAKLAGEDDLHDLEMDSMAENISDLCRRITNYWYEPNEEYKKYLHKQLLEVHLPFFLQKLNEIAEKNNGYFVREKLSWIDLYFVSMLDYYKYMLGFDMVETFPGLEKVKEHVLSIPAINEWVAKRPKTKC